jgi:glycosyltransferase involved in cell wall biosynthesis
VVLNEDARDGTEEIALKYGAKVHREPWKGHIGQKNSAAARAAQPWLLGLDADEAVSPALRAEITAAIGREERAGEFAAFSFPRLSFYCGRWIRHGDWHPDRKTRLWRRGRAQWGGEDPHDKLVVEGRVGKLRGDLLHYSNESIERQLTKIGPYQVGFVRNELASGSSGGFLAMVARPWWRFTRAYVFRLGFLDGWQGYYIAKLSAFSSLTRQAMVREARSARQPPS